MSSTITLPASPSARGGRVLKSRARCPWPPRARHWRHDDGAREPTGHRDQPVPPPTRAQPRRLVPLGTRGDRARDRRGPADPDLDRLRRVPLVPRDGARVVRGSGDRRAHERELRLHQGGPRGTAGSGRHLYGCGAGHDRERRMAAHGLPHARWQAVLRGHVLPAGAATRTALVPAGAGRHRRGLERTP